MEILKQTASVTGTPIQQIKPGQGSSLPTSSGILGIVNPESYNQKELFYFSPYCFKIQLIDNRKDIPQEIVNPSYPYSYECIFFDRGSNEANPVNWPRLNRIGGRAAFNVVNGTPWWVSWTWNGSFGYQIVKVNQIEFRRTAQNGAWSHWELKSNNSYGDIMAEYNPRSQGEVAINFAGWVLSSYVRLSRPPKSAYPEAAQAILLAKQNVNAGEATIWIDNQNFASSETSGKYRYYLGYPTIE